MPELKPSPICSSLSVGLCPGEDEITHEIYNQAFCTSCGVSGPRVFADEISAIAAWNSQPRALTWTTEPPKVAGIFLAESTLDNCSKKITPIEVFSSDHWRHSDWEKRHGKLSCLLCLGGFGVCPVSKYSRFAGPIPTPLEPGES